jgi:hypothetical protein
MRRIRGMAGVGAVTVIAAGAVVAGCGGAKQDANEPSGSFTVDVVNASFPSTQRLAKSEDLTIRVRNADTKTVPNLAVTVNSFTEASKQAGLADPQKPVWIVDEGPVGGTTAYVNTWALGALGPGKTKTFTWHVTPIQPGAHTVSYRVAAGLNGKAKAVLSGGDIPQGTFRVNIARTPPAARVDGDTGRIIRTSK